MRQTSARDRIRRCSLTRGWQNQGMLAMIRHRLVWAAGLVSIVLTGHAAATAPCAQDVDRLPPAVTLHHVVDGLDMPVYLTHASDGSGRLYVVEQPGVIRIIDNGRLLREPFLDIRDRVKSGGEKGLLSVAFAPDFAESKLFFVNYTADAGGLHTRIARYRAVSALQAEQRSEVVLLRVDQPYGNHNGGQIQFGPDAMLYIGMGDGGWANDPKRNGQDLGTLLGSLLRIDVLNPPSGRAYGIPQDNPFVGRSGARAEAWAYGLRNPWRFSFDKGTGQLWLADVGQNAQEEIDIVRKGGNYGWNIMEGEICTPGVDRHCDKAGLDLPVWVYGRDQGKAVTGGYVYRGAQLSQLCGAYLFGDYVSGTVWGLIYRDGAVKEVRKLAELDDSLSSFGEDEQLNLYVLAYGAGKVLRVAADGEQ